MSCNYFRFCYDVLHEVAMVQIIVAVLARVGGVSHSFHVAGLVPATQA